jgi:hypothetical protein
MELMILIAPIGSIDRADFENIENSKFYSKVAIMKEFNNNPNITIMSLSEFMTLCNDMDGDTPKEDKIDINDNWIGYIRLYDDYDM